MTYRSGQIENLPKPFAANDAGRYALAVAVLLLAAAVSQSAAAPADSAPVSTNSASVFQSATAVRETEDAAKLIQDGRPREAIEALDRAIAADDEYWAAYYQRGRALGQLGRWQESKDALLRAVDLNPGHGHSHRLASLAAAEVDDWDAAWDQAIKAQLAGEDMTQTLLEMYNQAAPPDDFEVRIQAVTVFVADIDTSNVLADVDLPTNFNPNAPAGTGQRQGRGANLEDSAINQSSADLIRLQRAMRNALAASSRIAVTLNPGQAEYVLSISLTDIGTSEPRAATGYFRLLDIGGRDVVYRAPVDFADISASTIVAGKLRRYVVDLEAWLVER